MVAAPAAADLGLRERKKLAVRRRILEAAVEVASETGFGGAKVAEICGRADVSQKTFFNYFPSKRALLRELAGFSLDELLADWESARKEERTTAARLERFFAKVAERVEQGGALHRRLVTEIVHAAQGSPEQPEHARRLHESVGALVREGLEAGEVTRRHAPETLIEMILGAYYVLIFDYANVDGYPLRERAQAAARFLADALARNEKE